MLALRRAANPLSHRIAVARTCCNGMDMLCENTEIGYRHERENRIMGIFLNPCSYKPTISSRSLIWARNLSSHAGARSSDDENELGEGFSDLETPLETDKIEDVEGGASEEEVDDSTLGFSDVEAESNDEKKAVRGIGSSLFKILMETPWQSIGSVLDKWVNESKTFGREEINVAVLNLRKRRFYGKALQIFEWLEANKQLDFTERDYASHLELIAKVHGIQRAEKYIDNIPESFRSEIIYRTLLANCVAASNVKKSEEVFNKIKDLGFPITSFACNQLLLLYKRVDRKKIADVLKLMEKENVKPSLFTFRLLIDTKGRVHDISGMEDLVEMMKAEGMEPDLGVNAILAKHYIFDNRNEKAEAVLKEIEGDDVKENRSACRQLLPLYAALGKADDVERIWKVCEADPHLEECLAAIEAWGKLGKVENAEKVFELMMKTWNKLSPRYYNALIKVYANHKLLSKGKDLAKKMSENGCKIGPLTWDALVKLYVEAGEVEKADSILQKAVQQNQIRPLYSSYIVVLDKYAKRGDIHNAEKIFQKARQLGYTRRMGLYFALLQAYINAKAPAYGFRERMKADNIFPNRVVTAQLVAIEAFKKSQISELLD